MFWSSKCDLTLAEMWRISVEMLDSKIQRKYISRIQGYILLIKSIYFYKYVKLHNNTLYYHYLLNLYYDFIIMDVFKYRK